MEGIMSTGLIVGLCILGAFVALILFMVIRALLAGGAKKKEKLLYTPIEVDKNEVAQRLSDAVKIPTVSITDPDGDYGVFDEYLAFLERTYPLIHKYAEKTIVNGHSIILKIDGTDGELLPACFLSHQDVVPAVAEEWSVDPFGGEIKDGFVYGRGSLDMKGHMIVLMEGLERILSAKEKPVRTIYLCFGHDEELTGLEGACNIVEYLYERNVKMEYVIDEGGVIMDGAMLGVNQKVAAIGTCEKGYVDFVLTSKRNGGHASSPKKRSSVDEISEAVFYLSHMPMKAYLSKPIKSTFKTMVPYMNFPFRLMFANMDILAPLLKLVLPKLSPITNSLMRTTFAFTQLKGSDAPNIIPVTASAIVNVRINVGQTSEDVKKYMQKIVGKNIEISVHGRAFEPSGNGNANNPVYKEIARAVEEVFGYISTPYPFIAASDAKYYKKICDNVYRFGPLDMEQEDQNRIHSRDERCGVESLAHGTQFFYRFIENTCY